MTIQDKILLKNLAQTADIVNTINGGMSQASFKLLKQENEWMVKVEVPGVDADNMRIEVRDDQMFIFQIIGDEHAAVQIPYLVTTFKISSKVNYDDILAEYENGEIFIHLPIDETGENYQREIEIIKK